MLLYYDTGEDGPIHEAGTIIAQGAAFFILLTGFVCGVAFGLEYLFVWIRDSVFPFLGL